MRHGGWTVGYERGIWRTGEAVVEEVDLISNIELYYHYKECAKLSLHNRATPFPSNITTPHSAQPFAGLNMQ